MNRYGRPTTYKRIAPERGSGFILKRIYDLTEDPKLPRGTHVKNPTKQDVYVGTNWANRPGWSSLLWSSLIKDGLIESDDGMQEYKYYSFYMHPNVGTRAAGHYAHNIGYTVRYHLTPKGRGILFDMMNRVNAKGKALNSVGSVAEHDAKKDECPVKTSEWREDDFLLSGETKEEWAKRNGVTLQEEDEPRDFLKNMTKTDLIREYRNAAMEADRLDAQLLVHENDENGFARDRISAAYNNVCTRRNALAKEIELREKNEAHDILQKEDDDQKSRAEMNDLKERLKKVREQLIEIEEKLTYFTPSSSNK